MTVPKDYIHSTMANNSRLEECLKHADAARMYSIGANIIYNPPNDEYVRLGLQALKEKVTHLYESEVKDDKQAVSRINKRFLQDDYKRANSDLHMYVENPVGKNIVEWISASSDHDLEQFCIWSFERTRQLARAIQRDESLFIDHVLGKTEKLERIGLFPTTAVTLMEAATEHYMLEGMDSFFSGGRNWNAFCNDYQIVSSNRYSLRGAMLFPPAEMKRTMFHEYLHGAGRDRGFFFGIKKEFRYNHLMEEAFVEHASTVAHTPLVPRHRVIDPSKRPYFGELGIYTPERTFLAAVTKHADIAIEHIAEAYFSPRGSERGEHLRGDIERKIGRFFGSKKDFFAFANDYQNTLKSERDDLITNKLAVLTKPPHNAQVLV